MATIYGIRAKNSDLYFYVGSTKYSAEHRLKQHLDYIRLGHNKNRHFVNKINLVGIENLALDTLEECNELSRWEIEYRWINQLLAGGHPLTNIKLNDEYSNLVEQRLDYDNYPITLEHIETMYAIYNGEISYSGDKLVDALYDLVKKLATHIIDNHPEFLEQTIKDLKNKNE